MAIVPLVERTVQARPLPDVQFNQQSPDVPAAAFGNSAGLVQAGQAMAGLGENLDKMSEGMDAARVLEAKNAADDFLTTLRTDPDKGYLSKRGRNAAAVPAEYTAQFQDYLRKQRDGLQSPRQQMAWDKMAASLMSDFKGEVGKYAASQLKDYQDIQFKTGIEKTMNNAALHADNPNRVAQEVDNAETMARAYAHLNGLPPDAIDTAVRDARTKTFKTAFEATLDKSPSAAQALLAQHRDSLSQDDAQKFEHALKPAMQQVEAAQIAQAFIAGSAGKATAKTTSTPVPPTPDQIPSQTDGMASDGLGDAGIRIDATPEEAAATEAAQAALGGKADNLDAFNKISRMTKDPVVAQQAMRMVDQHYKAIEAQQKQIEREASDAAWRAVNNGEPVPNSVMAKMDQKELAEMRNSNNASDPLLYEELRGRIIAGSEIDLSKYRWRLAGRYDELVKLQQDPNAVANARTKEQMIGDVLPSIGLPPNGSYKDEATAAKVSAYRNVVDAQIEAWQKANGKPAPLDVVKSIVNNAAMQWRKQGFWGGTGYAFQRTPGVVYEIDGMPREMVNNMTGKKEPAGYIVYNPEGKQVATYSYDDVITHLNDVANTRGTATPETVKQAYLDAVARGRLRPVPQSFVGSR